ncbi:hypothetical protein N9878_00325 [bacterium]|nr:hypothetical protein [bacterium]
MKKFTKAVRVSIMVPLGIIAIAMTSCAFLTPTTVPPLTEELGYKVLNWHGVTTTSLVRGTVRLEQKKLQLWSKVAQDWADTSDKIRDMAVDLVAVVGLGGLSALPSAFDRLPKGAVRKEDHERMVKEAFEKDPKRSDEDETA